MPRVQLGQLLKQAGIIDDRHVRSALGYQQHWGVRFGRALVELNAVTEEQLVKALARQLGIPAVRIGDRQIPPEVLSRVPERTIRSRHVLPLEIGYQGRVKKLVVAFSMPEDLPVMDEVAFAAGMEIIPVLVGERDMEQAITRHLDAHLEAYGWGTSQAAEPDDDIRAFLQYRTEVPLPTIAHAERSDALELPPEPSHEMLIESGRHGVN